MFPHIRDIILLFIITAGILALSISVPNETKESESLYFNGFSPPAYSNITNNQIKDLKSTPGNFIVRKFKWFDADQKERETEFKIKKSYLKNEIKRFGLSKGMTNTLFMRKRGFKVITRINRMVRGRLIEKVTTIVDYKKIFQRNIPYFLELTKQLRDSIPNKNIDPVYSFLKFVQYLPYRRPPVKYSGRFIGKFFVPLVSLYEQYGDCDSKSLLLSEFLATYPNYKAKMGMVLIHGQGLAHALLAVKQKPLMGMTSILINGSGYYVLIETTRPRWSPGFINYRVQNTIKAGYIRFIPLN